MNRVCVEDDLYTLVARLSSPMTDAELTREIGAIAEDSDLIVYRDREHATEDVIDDVEIETLWEKRKQDVCDYFFDNPLFANLVVRRRMRRLLKARKLRAFKNSIRTKGPSTCHL